MKSANRQKASAGKDQRPPKIAEWILGRCRAAGDAFSLLGDLHEEYDHRVETLGRSRARWWYRREILISLPEFTYNFFLWSTVIFKNYLKTTWRVLRRSKGFSIINITGLAVGLACSLIIALYIHHERNFDRFHKERNRIFRVCSHIIQGAEVFRGAWSCPPLAEALKEEFPEVEAAARAMGLSDPVGKRIHKEWGGAKPGEFTTIIGVLKDFHFASLHEEIQPMILRPFMERSWNYTSVKIRSDNIPRTLGLIESEWKTLTGGQPFNYSFLDSDFDRLYKSEQRTGRIFGIFGLLALFVACLGLFGLLSYTVERRTKEIGIRKVLGASGLQITTLITQEVFLLVLIASVVSAPPAYFVMQKWLQNFAYRVPISGILFLLTALFLVTAALMSVGFRAVKAAAANPSESLKYE